MAKAKEVVKRANEDYIVMAEYRLLNALIHNKAYQHDSRLHENTFPHALAKSFYNAITELHELGQEITPAALHQRANELDYNASLEVARQIYGIDNGASTIADMVKVLHKAKQKQDFAELVKEISMSVNAKGDIDTGVLLAKLYDAEQILAQNGQKELLKSLDTWIENYLADFKERGAGRVYRFGDPLLDKALVKGAYPGAITIIAGGTGQGKSTYVLNMINGMINQAIPCMYLSLEMSDIDTMDRLISIRREIPTADLYNPGGDLDSIIRIIEEERIKLKKSNLFYFVDDPEISLAQLPGMIKEFKQKTKSEYCVIAIDLLTQIQEFMESGMGGNLAQVIERAMNKLNIIAKKENVHIIGVVQFNREADNTKVTEIDNLHLLKPTLNNIKNAHAIAERSRAVLGLFRAKYYADRYCQDDEHYEYMEDILEVQVLKQSNGATPLLKYDYDGEVFRTTPYVEKEDDRTEEEKAAETKLNF